MNREIRNKFIYQLQALLHKYRRQALDVDRNLSTLHANQTSLSIKIGFATNEVYAETLNRLEVIKKDIQNQNREAVKLKDKIKDAEMELHGLTKNIENGL